MMAFAMVVAAAATGAMAIMSIFCCVWCFDCGNCDYQAILVTGIIQLNEANILKRLINLW